MSPGEIVVAPFAVNDAVGAVAVVAMVVAVAAERTVAVERFVTVVVAEAVAPSVPVVDELDCPVDGLAVEQWGRCRLSLATPLATPKSPHPSSNRERL